MESPRKAQDGVDPDFIWAEYLEETKAVAAPPEAFSHVEYSLESSFKVGMQLEIPHGDDGKCYWIASVVMTCGELLSLRYAGYGDDRSRDFWFNIKSGEFHPIGWCKANAKKLFPPKGVLEKHPDVNILLEKELKKVETIPSILSEDLLAGFMPIDQIKCGMKVEVLEATHPENIWIATILQNVGGRLLLRYDGLTDKFSAYDFWIFYLCDRLFQVGYASENNMKYSVPAAIKERHSEDEWDKILQKSLKDSDDQPFPANILEPKIPLEEHGFKKGMKLEAVDPDNYCNICPATVSKIVNNFYFLVTIDSFVTDETEKSIVCCNSNQQMIFPINWAKENGLELSPPKGYKMKDSKFVWDEYLSFSKAVAAPYELFTMCCMNTGFQNDMKLEAADPLCPNKIYAATIETITEPIMFLRFDVEESNKRNIIVGINSFDVYPVGWCASNGYPLQTPAYRSKLKNSPVLNMAEEKSKTTVMENKVPIQTEQQQGKSWCPKIYFNHRCFSGPFLSKSRLAELPKAIGPGAVSLVMNDVISRVVNIAYKSSRVLQILQVHGKPTPGMQHHKIKAKYKGKSYVSIIEVIQHSDQVEDFCKKICSKLECCPYLFGPKLVEGTCPSSCHTQTKTKFGYNFVKKHKKPGRPPSATTSASTSASALAAASTSASASASTSNVPDSSSETVRKGPGRKKKRKHWTQLLSASENSQKENTSKPEDSSAAEDEVVPVPDNDDEMAVDETVAEETSANETVPSSSKVNSPAKKKLKHIPISSIVTRGAKLPNFGLWHHLTSFHSRRGRPRTKPVKAYVPRKVGRPLGSTKKPPPKDSDDDDSMSTICVEEEVKPEPKVSSLESNPNDWSVDEVIKYIQQTECAPLASKLKEEEIDGQALLMLNIQNVQEHLNLKPEPAKKLCYLIKDLKVEFFTYFAS